MNLTQKLTEFLLTYFTSYGYLRNHDQRLKQLRLIRAQRKGVVIKNVSSMGLVQFSMASRIAAKRLGLTVPDSNMLQSYYKAAMFAVTMSVGDVHDINFHVSLDKNTGKKELTFSVGPAGFLP